MNEEKNIEEKDVNEYYGYEDLIDNTTAIHNEEYKTYCAKKEKQLKKKNENN